MKLLHWPQLMPGRFFDNYSMSFGYSTKDGNGYSGSYGIGNGDGVGYGFGDGNGKGYGNTKGTRYA